MRNNINAFIAQTGFVNYFIIFHLHLHTDEVIYETGLCNKCIYILFLIQTTPSALKACGSEARKEDVTGQEYDLTWWRRDPHNMAWSCLTRDLNITSLSVRWYFHLIGTSYAEWPSSDAPLRLSCLSCIQLITVPSPGIVSSEVSEPKSLHEPYMIRATVYASLVSQIVSHLSAKPDRPDTRAGEMIPEVEGTRPWGPRGKWSLSVSRGPKTPIQLLQLLKNSPKEVKRAYFRYILGSLAPPRRLN